MIKSVMVKSNEKEKKRKEKKRKSYAVRRDNGNAHTA